MPKRRVFFALSPPRGYQQSIFEQVYASGKIGRPVAPEKLHVTVLFLGSVDNIQIDCVCAAANTVRGCRFALSFDQIIYRKRQSMLWLKPSMIAPGLLDLERRLRQAVVSCEINLEKRGFNPHISLARKVNQRPKIPDINLPLWEVDFFTLVESIQQPGGNRYEQLQKWSLQ